MRRELETREYVPAARRGNDWLSSFPSVGDLFQSFFPPSSTGLVMPSLDLTETNDAYKVEVDSSPPLLRERPDAWTNYSPSSFS